jgi:hypothetical protein
MSISIISALIINYVTNCKILQKKQAGLIYLSIKLVFKPSRIKEVQYLINPFTPKPTKKTGRALQLSRQINLQCWKDYLLLPGENSGDLCNAQAGKTAHRRLGGDCILNLSNRSCSHRCTVAP